MYNIFHSWSPHNGETLYTHENKSTCSLCNYKGRMESIKSVILYGKSDKKTIARSIMLLAIVFSLMDQLFSYTDHQVLHL